MRESSERDRLIVSLLDATELAFPYVTLERLRSLARSEHPGARLAIGRWLGEAIGRGVVFVDARHRVRRDGRIVPERIYRLNRTHPLVAAALADPGAR